MIRKTLVLAALATVVFGGAAEARDEIRIVGSSTVFPFSATVAEQFARTTAFKAPVVESTGTGGGFKLFCAGGGDANPDISNASRRIKRSEAERCRKNGVGGIVEIKIGYDGIIMANARQAPDMALSLRDVYLALAKSVPAGEGKLSPNPYRTWKDVNPRLPDTRIEVLGPPPTSGTRDAFAELAMEGGCKSFAWVKAIKKTDKKRYKAICHTIREDGAYIEAGENDNLIVQKIEANPKAIGVFGFSFLDQNGDKIKGGAIGGIEPTFENIADGTYPVSRPLFFYVKQSRVGKVPGIREYIAEFTSERAWGSDGYLADKGLIPMSNDERVLWNKKAAGLVNLVM